MLGLPFDSVSPGFRLARGWSQPSYHPSLGDTRATLRCETHRPMYHSWRLVVGFATGPVAQLDRAPKFLIWGSQVQILSGSPIKSISYTNAQ